MGTMASGVPLFMITFGCQSTLSTRLQNLRFAFLMMTPVNCVTWKLDGLPARLSLLFAVALQLSMESSSRRLSLRDFSSFAMRTDWANVFVSSKLGICNHASVATD